MNLKLPPTLIYPSENRIGCVVPGNPVYTSGHPPPENFSVVVKGKVGADVSEEDAHTAARATAPNIFASVEVKLGSLDRIKQVVKVYGMVNSAPGFDRQFAVIDGASDLMFDLFGLRTGQHARSAVGMFELPRQL